MEALIVEDDPQLAFLWTEAIGELGITATVVDTTDDAMSKLMAKRYDICLLDIFVKDGNTVSLSDCIAMRHPDCPILMVTGSKMFATGDFNSSIGSADWLLHKPVRVKDLQAMVAHLTCIENTAAVS